MFIFISEDKKTLRERELVFSTRETWEEHEIFMGGVIFVSRKPRVKMS